MIDLKCFHSGIRRNNSNYALAGRQKTAPVMFFNKHDLYHPIIYNDMKVRVLEPPQVENYLKNKIFQEQEIISQGKVGIILQKLKTNISRTISSLVYQVLKSREWQVRAIKFYQKNRDGIFDKANFPDPGKQKSGIFSFHKEVQILQKLIRESRL